MNIKDAKFYRIDENTIELMIGAILLAENIMREEGIVDPEWDQAYDQIESTMEQILKQPLTD